MHASQEAENLQPPSRHNFFYAVIEATKVFHQYVSLFLPGFAAHPGRNSEAWQDPAVFRLVAGQRLDLFGPRDRACLSYSGVGPKALWTQPTNSAGGGWRGRNGFGRTRSFLHELAAWHRMWSSGSCYCVSGGNSLLVWFVSGLGRIELALAGRPDPAAGRSSSIFESWKRKLLVRERIPEPA